MMPTANHAEIATSCLLPPLLRVDEQPRYRVDVPMMAGWRQRPVAFGDTVRSPRVVASRWCSLESRVSEVEARTAEDSHLLCIALRRMNIRLLVAGRLVKEGTIAPGTLHVTGPGVPAECAFKGAYDALHLHIDNGLIAECAGTFPGGHAELTSDAAPSHDRVIEQLGMSLLDSEQLDHSMSSVYSDSLGAAIVARLLALRTGAADLKTRSAEKLAKWRLKRVLDYIDAHLDEPIRLADMATTAGLTRMHFAAQFKAATGLRPHEYLLRIRVERAQILLSNNVPTVDVALAVGFQSQAHFTTVFKRFVGQPPHTWWRLLCATPRQSR
jgi:AraC family transcriptional regulator